MLLPPNEHAEALEYLGADLAAKNATVELLIVGGSGLQLLGIIRRPTRDIDVIAIRQGGTFLKASGLPAVLKAAIERVRRVVDLPDDWINLGPASVMDHGLPQGYEDRLHQRVFGSLTLHILGRLDMICLKLHAAIDRGEPNGKHAQDLRALEPTKEDLVFAAKWAMTQDPSAGFREVLCRALNDMGVTDADRWLPNGL